VYFKGTVRLAALFSDDNGTTMTNPFTAATNGYWFFYADPNHYDVKFEQGGLPAPFTLGDLFSGGIGGIPFVIQATSSPQVILAGTHNQGPNVSVDCWSGPLLFPYPGNYGHVTGHKVFCDVQNDGSGIITVTWFDDQVKSIMISASGYGPIGPSGPAGYGAYPYVANATVSPMSIPYATHGQGTNVTVDCWGGPLVGGSISGVKVFCQAATDGGGNVTLVWGAATVKSFMISASGRAQPYVTNTTVSPQTILATTHKQGFTPDVTCWDGIVAGSATQGHKVYCDVVKNSSGDVIITWGGSVVGSIQVQ
jgi:hypothetical protein